MLPVLRIFVVDMPVARPSQFMQATPVRFLCAQVRYASEARHPNIVQLLDVFVEFKHIIIVVWI